MAHLTRPAEISEVSAGSFPETAAGNRAYLGPYSRPRARPFFSHTDFLSCT